MCDKKIYIRYFFLLLLLVAALSVEARSANYFRLRGEQLYKEGRYLDALNMFEKYENNNPYEVVYDEPYLHRKAEIYFKLGQFDDALNSYMIILDTDPESINYKFFKGLIYRSTEPAMYSHILGVIDSVEQQTYATYGSRDTAELFSITPFYAVNTEFSEFGAVDFKGRIYFSTISNRFLAKKDINTELDYYRIYSVDYDKAHQMFDQGWGNYRMLNKDDRNIVDSIRKTLKLHYERDLNSNYNDGPITFLGDDAAFVTINSPSKIEEGKYRLTIDSINLSADTTDIFSKRAEHYFGHYFSYADVGQVAFSKDGTMACMVVKMKDSSTGADLWFSQREEGGKWGAPHIAGKNINTDMDEVFPYWSEDDYLYFSSSGLLGMGGLDVFRVDMLHPHSKPQNVGSGVNSPYDDFAISLDSVGIGYITSNRPEGHGNDDIYAVSMNYGNIKVVLRSDTALVDNPLFALSASRNNRMLDSVNVRTDTFYVVSNLPYGEYDLMHSFPVDSMYEHVPLYADTVLVYVYFPAMPDDTLPVSFTNFCFNCDGMDEINADKFQRMVDFLKTFPEIEVVLTGNTDMFGTNRYNNALGMRRAEVMERWLREEGVVNPVVKSTNGKRKLISKTDHRLNRRVDVDLYWPEDPERIVSVSEEDTRLDRNVAIEYDSAKKYDKPLTPGYYIFIYRSNRYMDEAECGRKFGVGDDVDILLHSTRWNLFNYYLNIPFESAIEAQEIIEVLNLDAKIVYLK